MSTETVVEKGAINLKDRIKVYATASNPYAKEGEEMNMGLVAAQFALDNGYATKDAPKGKQSKKAE